MFIQEFSKEILPIESIQFATGIALDNLNQQKAAKSVIGMYKVERTESPYKKAEFSTREELERHLLINGNGLVYSYIHYLYNNDCIAIKSSGMYSTTKFVSLDKLVSNISETVLTHEIMRIILNNSSDTFIYLYAKSSIFKGTLSKFLYRNYYMSADSVRKNVYSQDVINSIITDFADYVYKYSCNGAYKHSSGTPENFLIHTFQSYYSLGGDMFKILNTKSTMSTISKNNDLTLNDYAALDSDVEDNSIDFIKLATKINKSSYSLYNHSGDGGIAYYDIFSWYRDNLADSLYENNRSSLSKFLRGIKLTKPIVMEEVSGTKRDKGSRRNKLCHVYFNAINDGMNITDIFTLYRDVCEKSYDLCQHRNSNGGASDGSAYYAWRDISPKSKTTNADKFKADYEGFIALKELVDFLNSASNNTGITIFNMPTDIFRDGSMLRRFSTFRDYIILYADVRNLMDEIDIDNYRSAVIDGYGIRNNDSVFDRLMVSIQSVTNVQNKEVLNRIFKTPLSAGKMVVRDKNETKRNILNSEIIAVLRSMQANMRYISGYSIQEILSRIGVVRSDIEKVFTELKKPFYYVCKVYMDTSAIYKSGNLTDNEWNLCLFNLCFITCNAFEAVLIINKNLPNEYNHFYDISTINLDYIFGILTNHLTDNDKTCINVAYSIATSTLLNKLGNANEDFRNILINARVMQSFYTKIVLMLNDIHRELLSTSDKENMYVVYARAISQHPVLEQKWEIQHIKDLKLFFDNDYTLLPIDINQLPMIEYKNIEKRRNDNLILCAQRFFSFFRKNELTFICKFNIEIEDTLVISNNSVSVNKSILALLARANITIITTMPSTSSAQKLESLCVFSDSGFAISCKNQANLFTFRNKKEYIHKYGYIVSVERVGNTPFKLTAITDSMFAKIKEMYF